MTRKYAIKHGGRIYGKVSPQVVGETIEIISHKNNGTILPKQLVDEARDHNSPIHECFDWDDSRAAESFREMQARDLLRTIIIMDQPTATGEVSTVRAFHSIVIESRPNEKESTAYMPINVVLSNNNYRQQIIDRALRELEEWKEKWNLYNELLPIIEAISLAQRRFTDKPRKGNGRPAPLRMAAKRSKRVHQESRPVA